MCLLNGSLSSVVVHDAVINRVVGTFEKLLSPFLVCFVA